jgi:hypothetical protein
MVNINAIGYRSHRRLHYLVIDRRAVLLSLSWNMDVKELTMRHLVQTRNATAATGGQVASP